MSNIIKPVDRSRTTRQPLLLTSLIILFVFGFFLAIIFMQISYSQKAYTAKSFAANYQQTSPPPPEPTFSVSLPFRVEFNCENKDQLAQIVRWLVYDFMPCNPSGIGLPGGRPTPDPTPACKYIKDTWYNAWLKFSTEKCCPGSVISPEPTIFVPEEMQLDCIRVKQYILAFQDAIKKSGSCPMPPMPTGFPTLYPTLSPERCQQAWDNFFAAWLEFIDQNCCRPTVTINPSIEVTPSPHANQPCCGYDKAQVSEPVGPGLYRVCIYHCVNLPYPDKYAYWNQVCDPRTGNKCTGSFTLQECQAYARWACCYGSDLIPCPVQGISRQN